MRLLKLFVLMGTLLLPVGFTVYSQTQQSQTQPAQTPQAAPPAKPPGEEGIPVTNQLVIAKCSTCHKADDKGNLTRISWERTTPEGWQQIIKRMVRLNGLTLSPEEARQIVRYLSANHGLAPEEARPAFYEVEHRVLDETVPDENLRNTCTICHTYGRVQSQRRSKEEWDLLVNMHVGYFPVVEFQGFRRFPPPPDAPPPPPGTDTRHPADRAVEFLAKTFPLHTPEWAAWRANSRKDPMRPSRPQGPVSCVPRRLGMSSGSCTRLSARGLKAALVASKLPGCAEAPGTKKARLICPLVWQALQ
ncbi:MAG TPA: c-type cytochrome, partial [Blastocatellia bacterium]|nr:c-type cytochrome [Blastocatellia bacterium]